ACPRFSAGQAFPAFRDSKAPETPTLAIAGRAYSGLHQVLIRLVYKDERSGVGTIAVGDYYCELPKLIGYFFAPRL
ncbi:MAG: hypothetical protein NTY50_01300, partial [Methylobacter sp.]|nr:hypothetical protein [Methylobacter sp.]